MICLKCGKEIDVTAKYTLLGFDKPYLNIKVHRECYPKTEQDRQIIFQNLRKQLNGTHN